MPGHLYVIKTAVLLTMIFIGTFGTFGLTGCQEAVECTPKINRMPLYGKGKVEKCAEQYIADQQFISECKAVFPSVEAAARHYANEGWEFFYLRKLDSAIIRFNQTWLLDSTNSGAYWGIANTLGLQKKYEQSLEFFEKARSLDPDNPKIYHDMAISYIRLYNDTKQKDYLFRNIRLLKHSLALDSTYARSYARLAESYQNIENYEDSTLYYLKKAYALDTATVGPQLKRLLRLDSAGVSPTNL